MKTFLVFTLGLTIGAICGVVFMCCFQINKLNRNEE